MGSCLACFAYVRQKGPALLCPPLWSLTFVCSPYCWQAIVETLQATSRYHASSFAAADFALVGKLCSWPAPQLFPALDLLRMLLLHPDAARHYAGPGQTALWAALQAAAAGGPPLPANLVTATRTAVNTFRHSALQDWAAAHQAQVS